MKFQAECKIIFIYIQLKLIIYFVCLNKLELIDLFSFPIQLTYVIINGCLNELIPYPKKLKISN